MIRVLVHMACPEALRAIAATMAGLSGLIEEHSVELQAIPGGPSAEWDALQGYSGTWYGASQPFSAPIAQGMLESGYILGTQSWFVAIWEESGTLVQHNLTTAPANPSWAAFLAAAGLQKVEAEP